MVCFLRFFSDFLLDFCLFRPAPPHAFVKTSRAELIQAILRDLKTAGPKSRLTAKGACFAPRYEMYGSSVVRCCTSPFGGEDIGQESNRL